MSGAEPPSSGIEEVPWQRLSARMIWVDLVQSLLSLAPGVFAIGFIGVDPSPGTLWPLAAIAVLGIAGAVNDATRWVFTRYRVTDTEIQRRSGVIVRRYRSVRRERIRSVDTHAKLRHRLAGLRVVAIGAGQQLTANEAAFDLNALAKAEAFALRQRLMRERAEPDLVTGEEATEDTGSVEVLARFRAWWVVYNVFSIWAYLMATAVLWGAFWIAATFGVDLVGVVSGLTDWRELGWVRTIAVGALATGIIGAVGMAASYFTGYWRFELARVRHDDSSHLRTRRGLFSTREVNRDESRTRGLSISEPLLWRWMGMADTNIITTGLGLWSLEQPTALLPRGPMSVARPVAAQVLGEPCPITAELARHPRAALRRRLWWATLVVAAVVALLAAPVATGAAPLWLLWVALGSWPLALLGAFIAHDALGHALHGDYVVMRSGLMTRTTSALRRDAVSTIAVRQSVLQQRLGLATVSTMTAAGWSIYEAPDVDVDEAFGFADEAAPGLLSPFLHRPD